MFGYLIDKIEAAPFLDAPFRHIELNDFFSGEHFAEIIASPEIALPTANDDRDLIAKLTERTYLPIEFPGTASTIGDYLSWRDQPARNHTNVDTCEGFGVTLRLQRSASGSIIAQLNEFFASDGFLGGLRRKFSIEGNDTRPDSGLQKYLSGYEISPHPDIRAKALTYMINVNAAPDSEQQDYHTHYMRFRPERAYVEAYWRGNPEVDRCWVPWSWCETVKRQKRNNSIVLFAPSNDTIHAVKAAYDHRQFQRTQFYGNLWLRDRPALSKPAWHDFEISPTEERRPRAPSGHLLKRFKAGVRRIVS